MTEKLGLDVNQSAQLGKVMKDEAAKRNLMFAEMRDNGTGWGDRGGMREAWGTLRDETQELREVRLLGRPQSLNIRRDGTNLVVRKAQSDVAHHLVFVSSAFARAIGRQLYFHISRVLPGNRRILSQRNGSGGQGSAFFVTNFILITSDGA